MLVLLGRPAGLEGAPLKTLAATAWVATWWIFESLPIAATSLLPLILLPLLGVKSAGETAALYVEDLLFMLLGGLLLALALERSGLHRRFAIACSPCWAATRFRTLVSAAGTRSSRCDQQQRHDVVPPIALAPGRRLAGGFEVPTAARHRSPLLLAVAYARAGGLPGRGTPTACLRERYVDRRGARRPARDQPPVWMLAFAARAALAAGSASS